MRFLNEYIDASRPLRTFSPENAAETLLPPDSEAMEAHLARRRYGRFTLTEAVRPSWQLDVVPQAGYRFDSYLDPQDGARLPAIIGAVSCEDLFETFLRLLEPLGDTCDGVLETSHESKSAGHEDFLREGIDRTVLESILWDFEDLLLNDGCTGIAVMHPERPLEVQLDEHKLLIVYAHVRTPFERILASQGIQRQDRMRYISQGEHLHTSHTKFGRRFAEMAARLSAS